VDLTSSGAHPPLGMGWEEIGQLQGGGCVFDVFCTASFQGGPAWVGMLGGEGDVADEAAPFHEGALDVAGAERCGEEFRF